MGKLALDTCLSYLLHWLKWLLKTWQHFSNTLDQHLPLLIPWGNSKANDKNEINGNDFNKHVAGQAVNRNVTFLYRRPFCSAVLWIETANGCGNNNGTSSNAIDDIVLPLGANTYKQYFLFDFDVHRRELIPNVQFEDFLVERPVIAV